jgi:trk system potassium uptake protein TrkH
MGSSRQIVLRDLGLFLHVPGLMALVSVGVSVLWGEYYGIVPFFVTAIASFVAGQILYRFCRGGGESRLRHAMITAALGWGIIPLFGAIPFLMIALHFGDLPDPDPTTLVFINPWNALFESFSGLTSTGLSMALNPSQLPHSLQWWRSFTEWIGGVGVIVLVLSLLEPSEDSYQLYYAEAREKTIALTVQATVRRIWWIYLLYTLAGVMLLRLLGMPWWDALNHGLTGISTGGFSVRDQSIGAYSPLIQSGVIMLMIAGAISFIVHDRLLHQRRFSILWEESQLRAFWVLLVMGTGILLLVNYALDQSWLWLDSLFQWSSALGTCGFNTTDLQQWTPRAKLLLTFAMVIGGTAGSTVGGLKIRRLVFLWKGFLWRFQQLLLKPHQLMRFKLDGRVIAEAEANSRIETAAILAVTWIALLTLGVFILLGFVSSSYTLSDVLFEVASALGSVGLSTGITHPDLAWEGKLTLILLMWMGRLEIIPVLLLIYLPLRQLNKIR